MATKLKTCPLIVSILTVFTLASCETVSMHRFPGSGQGIGHGPPAHAQAHGYRRKHIDGLELVYDSAYGVYVIVGMPNHYYCDGHFYRMYGGVWEVSLRVDANWSPATIVSLPPGLQTKAKGRAIGHKKKVVASASPYKSKHKKVH
jgi:hypothetical protein